MKGLPDFRAVSPIYAEEFAREVFGEAYRALLSQEGGYYRVLFAESYFTIQPGNDAPSRSQWNTLKKRMKRVNPGVFVLKETGETDRDGTIFCYIDFGFLRESR